MKQKTNDKMAYFGANITIILNVNSIYIYISKGRHWEHD